MQIPKVYLCVVYWHKESYVILQDPIKNVATKRSGFSELIHEKDYKVCCGNGRVANGKVNANDFCSISPVLQDTLPTRCAASWAQASLGLCHGGRACKNIYIFHNL